MFLKKFEIEFRKIKTLQKLGRVEKDYLLLFLFFFLFFAINLFSGHFYFS
jgi:hypothetical protein